MHDNIITHEGFSSSCVPDFFYETFVEAGYWGLLEEDEISFWKDYLLWWAAGEGDQIACETLLRMQADPNATVWAHPPIHHAAWRRQNDMLGLFMHRGTNMDLEDRWTMTVHQITNYKANEVDCLFQTLLSFSDNSHIDYCLRCLYERHHGSFCPRCSYIVNSPSSSCSDCKYHCFSC